MVYTRFIEFGRLVSIQFGKYTGKLAVITDILDIKTVQVQGVEVPRQVVPVNHIVLTDQVDQVKAPIAKDKAEGICKSLISNYEKTTEGKKLHAKALRENLKDFERFTALQLCQERQEKIHAICKPKQNGKKHK